MSVERDHYRRHIPYCATRTALVDQYMWDFKDSTLRTCQNGTGNPIYACNGVISRTLPLHEYPLVGEIHPAVRQSSQPHFMARDPHMARAITVDQMDLARGRLEGFYL